MKSQEENENAIELMLDEGNSVSAILSFIAAVCCKKADHVSENWNDATLARVWLNRSERLDEIRGNERIFS